MAEVIDIAEQVTCVQREIKYRKRVYANRVLNGKMTEQQSTVEQARMEAVLLTLITVQEWAAQMIQSIENGAEPYESARRLLEVAPMPAQGSLL